MAVYPRSRNFLAISLLLFYLACILFGWQWATLQESWSQHWPLTVYPQLFWVFGGVVTLAVTGFFTKPLSALRVWVKRLFESDTRMFFAVIFFTSVGVLLLVNLAVLAEAALIIGVILLARFDLRMVQIRGWRQFAILSLISLTGFFGGGYLHWAVRQFGSTWLQLGLRWIQSLF